MVTVLSEGKLSMFMASVGEWECRDPGLGGRYGFESRLDHLMCDCQGKLF